MTLPLDIAVEGALYGALSRAIDKANLTLRIPTTPHSTRIEDLHEVAKAAKALAEYLPEGINRDAAQLCADEALRVAYDSTLAHVKNLEAAAKETHPCSSS